jgi:hypothetical protein
LIGYISLSFAAAACREKKEPSDSDISTPREREKYLSTIRESTTRKRRGNIQHHYHYNPHHHQHKRERQIDVWLVQVILSRFFFFRSFASMLLLYDVLTCVFFLLFLSSVMFGAVSFSMLLTNTIITLLDDLVDYFVKTKQVSPQWKTGELNPNKEYL